MGIFSEDDTRDPMTRMQFGLSKRCPRTARRSYFERMRLAGVFPGRRKDRGVVFAGGIWLGGYPAAEI